MIEIALYVGTFAFGFGFCWFFFPMAVEAALCRKIKRLEAARNPPRPMTPEERLAALEPEIHALRTHEKGEAA